MYLSGNGAFARNGVFVRSDDGGATWEQLSFDMRSARAPFIAAVDPTNPDVVWLRLTADELATYADEVAAHMLEISRLETLGQQVL